MLKIGDMVRVRGPIGRRGDDTRIHDYYYGSTHAMCEAHESNKLYKITQIGSYHGEEGVTVTLDLPGGPWFHPKEIIKKSKPTIIINED